MFFIRLNRFFRKNWREIAYYAAVMLVLGGLAWGAEIYRAERNMQSPLPLTVSADLIVNEETEKKEPFVIPGEMVMLNSFSKEPVWNQEMQCWQAHTAVDFGCEEVVSFCDGEVITIGESGVYGGFAEVEGDGMRIRYCSIQPDEALRPGAKIRMGDAIGIPDDSMPGEMHMGNHVHIEIFSGDEMLDAMKLKQNSD